MSALFEPQKGGLEQPNTLLAVDLFNTPVPEIIATGVRGGIAIFDSTTGRKLVEWTDPEEGALTGPVVGNFLGGPRLEIAAGTEDGRLLLFDGSTLEILIDQKIATHPFSVPPTVARFPERNGTGEVSVILAIDDSGVLYACYAGEGGFSEYWQPVRTGARTTNPVTVGYLRDLRVPDIVVPTNNGNVVIIRSVDGSNRTYVINENKAIETAVLLADFDNDPFDEMIFASDGKLHVREYLDDRETRLGEVISPIQIGAPAAGDPILAGTSDAGPLQSLIFLPTRNNLVAVNPARDWTLIQGNYQEFSGINTQLSLLPTPRGGFPYVAVGVNKVLRLLDTQAWFGNPGSVSTVKTDSYSVNEDLTNTVAVISVRSDESQSPSLALLGLTASGRIVGVSTRRPTLSLTDSPWMTRGGTPRRNPLYDVEYHETESARKTRLREHVDARTAEMEAAMEAGDWNAAIEAAEWRARFDPLNQQYQKDLRSIRIRKNLILIVIAAIAGLAVTALLGFVIGRAFWLRGIENKGRAAVSGGDFAKAEPLYEKLLSKRPGNARIQATLAMVYVATQNDREKTIPVYSSAYGQEPDKQNLLHAYATALLKAKKTDSGAREVYEKALGSYPEPARLEFGLGLCHKAAGEMTEAGKRFRAAVRGGYEEPEVYSSLVDVYLATQTFSAKALPAFQHEYSHRQQDQKFLEGYLLCCIDARQTDSSVETLCHAVLEGNSAFVPAYCHLASVYLQKNQTGSAIDEVRRALETDPQNETAIRMLAQCYLIEGRSDDTAVGAFTRAINATTDNGDFLKALTQIYYTQERYDSDAVTIYKKSFEMNPNDVPTLKALAQSSQLSANHDLTVRTVEALVHLGQNEPVHLVQLAKAYLAKNIFEPRTEKVFRDAIRTDPEDPSLRHGLARVLMLQAAEDADAIPVYEAHMNSSPGDREIGAQLARAYQKNHRYQDSLELCQRLLKSHPDDPGLKSLVALSSLYSNKIDEAVAEYTQILERNPDDAQARIHLAMAHAQKGRTDEESAALYEKALKLDSGNPDLYLAMARVHLVRGDSVKAVEYYKEVPKVKPGSEDLLIRNLNNVMAEHPDAIRVRWYLCEVLVAHGHLREAMEQLNTVYETNPNQGRNILNALDRILVKDSRNISALGAKGRILSSLGELDSARETLEKAYKLQPSNPEISRVLEKVYEATLKKKEDAEIRFRLARQQYMNQEHDKAIGNFQKTAQDYRWEGESTKMLGKCFTAKGMLDLALQEYKKLVVDEETKELLYDLAQRYEAKKDLVGAKTVYRQLFAADIDYKDVKTRFEMLAGSTSDPQAFEKTSIVQAMSEDAKRRYELLDELGRGAMGIVYRAKDKELDEVVALKILPDSMSNNPEAVRRFKIEARNARRLSHPNIVRIHDIGEEMGRKYISMEYVDGTDLKKRIREHGKLTLEDFFHYAAQIADAMNYAHRLGIVHRDIKPANIMLTSTNEVKITDFGIAKMLDSTGFGDAEGTMVGAVIGTPLYMSPEQVQGIPVDNRADIYAFGIMLYELINGRPPFTEGDLAYQHVNREPDPPETCPDEVWTVLKKCLEKDKEARFAQAAEIVDALRDVQSSLGA